MWYAADVAFALRDLLDNGVAMADERCRAFVAGYRERFPLSEESRASVPLFSRFSRLQQDARMRRSADLPDGPDYPNWLSGLQQRMRQRMAAYRAALVAVT